MSRIIKYNIMTCCLMNASKISMAARFFKNQHVNIIKQNLKHELATKSVLFVEN